MSASPIMRRRLRILLLVLLPLALLLASTAIFFRGGRGFFSPDTLESRSQSEILLPFTELPLYRSGYETRCLPLVEFLISTGHWSPSTPAEPRWLLLHHWNPQWHDGQTRLHKELTWYDEHWSEWTKQNPDAAKIFWPMLLTLLREPDARGLEDARLLLMLGRSAATLEQFDDLANRHTGRAILPASRPSRP